MNKRTTVTILTVLLMAGSAGPATGATNSEHAVPGHPVPMPSEPKVGDVIVKWQSYAGNLPSCRDTPQSPCRKMWSYKFNSGGYYDEYLGGTGQPGVGARAYIVTDTGQRVPLRARGGNHDIDMEKVQSYEIEAVVVNPRGIPPGPIIITPANIALTNLVSLNGPDHTLHGIRTEHPGYPTSCTGTGVELDHKTIGNDEVEGHRAEQTIGVTCNAAAVVNLQLMDGTGSIRLSNGLESTVSANGNPLPYALTLKKGTTNITIASTLRNPHGAPPKPGAFHGSGVLVLHVL